MPNYSPTEPLYYIVNISTISNLHWAFYNERITHKAVIVIIDFSPLWRTMEEKNVTQYQLLKQGIDNKTLDSFKKNKNITLLTLEKLCRILDCTPNDIVQFLDNE